MAGGGTIFHIVDNADTILGAISNAGAGDGFLVSTKTALETSQQRLWLTQNGFKDIGYNSWVRTVQGGASVGETATAQYGLASYEASAVATAEGVTTSVTPLASQTIIDGAETYTLVDGGVTFGVSCAQLAGAMAIGGGLGWKEYKSHPQFWTDLSTAISDGLGGMEVIPVIARAVEGGGIKTYCQQKHMNRAIEELYKKTSFKNEATQSSDAPTTTGSVRFKSGGISPAVAIATYHQAIVRMGFTQNIASDEQISRTYSLALDRFKREHPTLTPNYMWVGASTSGQYVGATGCNIRIMYINPSSNISLQQYDYTSSGGDRYLGGTIAGQGSGASIIVTTTQPIYTEYTWNDLVSCTTPPIVKAGSGVEGCSFYCNINSVNDAMLEGKDTTTSPSAEDFWNTFNRWRGTGFHRPWFNADTGEVEDEYWMPLDALKLDVMGDVDVDSDTQNESQKGNANEDPTPLPSEYPFPFIEPILKLITGLLDVPSDPIGETPTPVPPISGFDESQALWTVYNPTLGEVHQLGGYLWTENIITIIQQVFKNNPLDAIISLHQIYCTPTTGTRKNIKLGYLDSGVSSKIVTNQYVEIDCGTISVAEYFGDCRDYSNTKVEVYLPFIGIRTLSTADIVASKVQIKYIIDVYTGVCIAQIFITKSGIKQQLYTYEGNCSVQIPLTASDRTRLITGVTNTVISTITGGAMGGAGGALMGGIGAMANSLNNPATINRTGNLSGNGGAMNIKKPYLIVTSNKPIAMGNYKRNYGAPSYATVLLGVCKGFTKVVDCHLDNIICTDSEKEELYNMLKAGVIL